MVRGVRRDYHGVNVNHGDEAGIPKTMGKVPLFGAPNVGVVL
jgi:hypothetical protein